MIMTKASGTFDVASWDEKSYQDLDGGSKLTLASVTQKFGGDIVGEGAARWLMFYRDDGTARFVGLQRVTGTIGTRTGTFVLETAGDFDGKTATWNALVVPGSATGQLEGLSGKGTFGAPHGPTASFELQYNLG
jgi:hypothetical protein